MYVPKRGLKLAVGESQLDLNAIAQECGLLENTSSEDIMNKIFALEEKYLAQDLVKIYNYFLTICTDPEILMNIIRLTDNYRDKSTLSILLDILLLKNTSDIENSLKEKYINLRVMCAKAASNYKDTSAVNPLLYCLNNKDENYKIRLACADALGRIGDRYAVAPLIEVVKDDDEKSVYLRESAAFALGMLGDIRAVEPLVAILEAQKGLWSKFTFLKERIIEALGKLRLDDNKRVFNALKNALLDESPQVRINAIEAIMEIGNSDSVEVIKSCLNDNDNEVRKNALIALYNLKGRKILDEIITCDYDDFLKIEASALINEFEEDNDGENND